MKILFLFFVAVEVVLTYADCQQKYVYVKNGSELNSFLKTNIDPGTNIILTPGQTYSLKNDHFQASFQGKIDCPIVFKTEDLGNSDEYATVASAFSLLSYSEYAVFANVVFTGGSDATAVASSENVLFENVYFSSSNQETGVGMRIDRYVSNFTFRNCTFEKNSFVGFYSDGVEAKTVSFEQCRFVDNGLKDMLISAGNDISINDCTFDGDPYVGILSIQTLDIRDNVFNTTTKQTKNMRLYLASSETKGIRNNVFYMESGVAIYPLDTEKLICISNKVYGGGALTNAKIDDSC